MAKKNKDKNVIYAIVDDDEDYAFVREDIEKHSLQVKGWMRLAIQQMRKYRNQQRAGQN